jgi:hypothetical protein
LDAFTFVCEGIDLACPSVLACDIDVNHHLIDAIANAASALRMALARITFVCPRQATVSTQLTGADMGTAETPSAVGTGWRRTLSQLYRTLAAVETSPMEILYDRVLRLEQEVSALKRNLLNGSMDHE